MNDPRPIPVAAPAGEVERRVRSVVRPEVLAQSAYRVESTEGLVLLHAGRPMRAVPLSEVIGTPGDSVWIFGAFPPHETSPWISRRCWSGGMSGMPL